MAINIPGELLEYIKDLHPEQGIWINNQGRTASEGETFAIHDPATTEIICEMASGSEQDAKGCVDAAEAALPDWAARSPRERSEILRRAFELMTEKAEILAQLMSYENGKSLADGRAESGYAAEFFRWFAEEAVRSDGDYAIAPAGGVRTLVTARPVGVCALITPWNFPAAMATRKIAPALAAGNTVVLKPASETPLTALAVCQILAEAGVPAGVVNLLPSKHSAMVSQTWLSDPRVRLISFTGSTRVGVTLMEQAAKRVVNMAMELGGNASFIVGPGSDLPAAVEGLMLAKFRNGGQACTAANRIYVHADCYQEFAQLLVAKVNQLKVASAFAEQGSDIGPMVNERAQKTLQQRYQSAKEQGAEVLTELSVPKTGYFVSPAVIRVSDPHCDLLQNEIFGPICPIYVWKEETELLDLANGTEMGLASYVYGELSWALHIAERLEAGMIGVNRGLVSDPAAPFGGVKQSGIGREGAREGIREFQETQYFSVQW